MSEEHYQQVFQVGEPARLDLNNIRGSVQVLPLDSAVDDRAIIVKAVKDLTSGDGELTQVEMDQQEDGSVIIKTRFAGQDFPGFQQLKHRPCKIHYTVQVPKNCLVKVEAVSSTIELEKLEGTFEIGSVSGDLILRDLIGTINGSERQRGDHGRGLEWSGGLRKRFR